jgi:hypothetical protein
MNNLIAKLLLVSIVLSGTVLPVIAYSHSDDPTDTEQHESIDVADKHGHEQDTSCDHCCHVFAHSVGIFSTDNGVPWNARNNSYTPYSISYYHLSAAPPSPPPIFS